MAHKGITKKKEGPPPKKKPQQNKTKQKITQVSWLNNPEAWFFFLFILASLTQRKTRKANLEDVCWYVRLRHTQSHTLDSN